MTNVILFGTLILTLLTCMPIAICLGLAAVVCLWWLDPSSLVLVPQRLFAATDSFTLLAIPLFMFAGNIMERGGISKRLTDLATAIVGNRYGGYALVTVVASAFFAAISGSSPATVVAIGSIMIPAMVNRGGYKEEFATATQAAAGYIGVIIPPSIPMITYGVATGVSISKLFMAGFLPGLLIAFAMCVVAYVICRKNRWKSTGVATTPRKLLRLFVDAIPAILMPVIILGGIYGGIFTPTEAANIAVVYGLIVGLFVYKELKWRELPELLKKSGVSSTTVLLIISTASLFGLVLTRERVPAMIAEALIGISSNPFVVMLIINVVLLIAGTFMEANASIVIMAPILLPAVVALGVDPVHFGIVMIVNLAIGNITPPLGVNLFVAGSMRNMSIERIVGSLWPYLLVSILVLLLLTYIPAISLLLPGLA